MSSRANGYTPYRGGDKSPYRPDRPHSEQLVDLHVYIVPPEIWRDRYNNLLNQSVTETVSAGIIRVHPEQQVNVLRDEIDQQIGTEQIPREYVFLKSVGRSITKLKPKQEFSLKVKHFVPPQAYAPELYILEGAPDAFGGSSQGSTRPHSRTPELYNSISNSLTNRSSRQNKPDQSSKYDSLGERFTTNTNEDSGIAGLTPEESYRENYDDINYRRKQEDERRRQQEEDERRRREEEDRRRREDEDRRRREDDDRRRRDDDDRRRQEDEAERKRREEEDERKRQEEELKKRLQDEEEKERHLREKEEMERLEFEKKRQEEEKRKREEEERRRREDEERKKLDEERERRLKQKFGASENDENRFPSPPALKMTELTEAQRQRNFFEREKLFRELELAKEERKLVERQREELVRKAKQMQNKTQNRRNHARDLWKKRYFEEKKRTNPLEEQCNRLRHELDIIHRKLMNTLEGPKEKQTKVGDLKPSKQSNYKIQVTRMTHEIEELRTRLENSKMKLTAELKLRTQAETELRALRAELMQKKIHLSLQRTGNQQPTAFSSPAPPQSDMLTYRQPMITPRS